VRGREPLVIGEVPEQIAVAKEREGVCALLASGSHDRVAQPAEQLS
jgi:hypothetical protein